MKTLYLDLGMGAAGDMLTGALLGLFPEPDLLIEKLNQIEIPHVQYQLKQEKQSGIAGLSVHVMIDGQEEGCEDSEDHHAHSMHEHHHSHKHHHDHDEHPHSEDPSEHHHHHDHHHAHHSHRSLSDIEQIIINLDLSDSVRKNVLAVYDLLAEAESQAHGCPVGEIHFHEVGTMDAIADITAVCQLIDWLKPDQILASPIHVGYGTVECAHGTMPVPAPATAWILRGLPIYGGKIEGEFCTPTGAALIKHFVGEFCELPVIRIQSIGYGMGKKHFSSFNGLRALLGETDGETDSVCELSCNVDDMTAEEIGFATTQLLSQGALDVFTTPIGMKKSRPGTLITVICSPSDREDMMTLMFRYTSTIGIRSTLCQRSILTRKQETLHTSLGDVGQKTSTGFGVTRSKYEYDDLKRLAREHQMSLQEVRQKIDQETK